MLLRPDGAEVARCSAEIRYASALLVGVEIESPLAPVCLCLDRQESHESDESSLRVVRTHASRPLHRSALPDQVSIAKVDLLRDYVVVPTQFTIAVGNISIH